MKRIENMSLYELRKELIQTAILKTFTIFTKDNTAMLRNGIIKEELAYRSRIKSLLKG